MVNRLSILLILGSSTAFLPVHRPVPCKRLSVELSAAAESRRNLLIGGVASAAASLLFPSVGFATPMVTSAEFETILRDSSRSIQGVDFGGVKGETVTVRLVDGTTFGISDVIESPIDPRSPLKLAAICRQYKVPTKFLQYESALLSTVNDGSKKKKIYMNSIVQKAAEKEVIKRERMRQDEEERLAAVYQMEVDEANASK